MVLSFFAADSAFAQTCTSGGSSESPPSATALRSHRESFYSPVRIAVDGAGYVYTTDPRKGQVVVRDPYGRVSATVCCFNAPLGIAVDAAGRIYVGEQNHGRVTVFDRNWNGLFALGQGDGEFLMPNDIAIDSSTGWIYVSDSDANQIKTYAADGTLVRLFGGGGSGPGQLRFPTGVYVSPLGVGSPVEVFVADQNNDRIQVFDPDGTYKRCFLVTTGSSGWGNNRGRMQGLTGDSLGRIYVADAFQSTVYVLDHGGYHLSTIGSFGRGEGELRTPMDVAIDFHNRLFVTSANNSRVESYGLDSFTDPQVLAAVVDVRPDSIKRSNKKDFVSAYIEIPGSPLEQVDPTTVTANGVVALPAPVEIGDYDGDGIPDLRVDFDAESVVATVPDGDVTIQVSGRFTGGSLFEGSDNLRVMPEKGGKK